MSTPNAWRLVLARLFAEAEDRRLGTWSPTNSATPGREGEAADYIDARAEFVAEFEFARHDHANTPTPNAEGTTDGS